MGHRRPQEARFPEAPLEHRYEYDRTYSHDGGWGSLDREDPRFDRHGSVERPRSLERHGDQRTWQGAATGFEQPPWVSRQAVGAEAWSVGPSAPRPSHRGKGPKNFKRSDERMLERVCEALSDHDDIDASEIEVTVHDGEVTLAGTVDSRAAKRLAESVAEGVSGIVDVHNQLRVRRLEGAPPPSRE